jgi:hypothetical protein
MVCDGKQAPQMKILPDSRRGAFPQNQQFAGYGERQL